MFDGNWTWSHSIDDASDPGTTMNETNLPQNVYNLATEKASSSFDHRQRLVASCIYQFPLTKDSSRWVRWLFGQRLAGGNFTAHSGAPSTVNIFIDQANIGSGPSQRPNVSGDPNDEPKTPEQGFNTSIFSLLHCIHFGNARRNAVICPGLREIDLSLQKDVQLTEAAKLQFRAEAYNLFNTPTLTFRIGQRSLRTLASFRARRTHASFSLP
jgi:hypothetical protein